MTELPAGFTLDPPAKAQAGPPLPPGFTLDSSGPAARQDPNFAQKVAQTIAEFGKGVVTGILGIPDNYARAAQGKAPGAITGEMVNAAAPAAMLAAGKTPALGQDAAVTAGMGLGARSAEADAAGSAAVQEAVRPKTGPWDAGGAAQAEVAGKRAVGNAVAPGAAPAPAGGGQPPPMPPEVSGALDKALGPAQGSGLAAFQASKKAAGYSPAEIKELSTEFQRIEAQAAKDKGVLDAIPSESPPGAAAPVPFKPGSAKPGGVAAVEKGISAPGWLGRPQPTPEPLPPPRVSVSGPPERLAPATVPGSPATGTPPAAGPSSGPKASTTPSVAQPVVTTDMQALIDSLQKVLPDKVMQAVLNAGGRQVANALVPGSGHLISAALKSAKIYRFLKGVGGAAGDQAKLAPYRSKISALSNGDKSTRDLLQRVVVAANASRPVSSGKPK